MASASYIRLQVERLERDLRASFYAGLPMMRIPIRPARTKKRTDPRPAGPSLCEIPDQAGT